MLPPAQEPAANPVPAHAGTRTQSDLLSVSGGVSCPPPGKTSAAEGLESEDAATANS